MAKVTIVVSDREDGTLDAQLEFEPTVSLREGDELTPAQNMGLLIFTAFGVNAQEVRAE